MPRIVAVVQAAAIVQKSECFDDTYVGARGLGQTEPVEPDPRPVRGAMDSTPVESEVLPKEANELRMIHGAAAKGEKVRVV